LTTLQVQLNPLKFWTYFKKEECQICTHQRLFSITSLTNGEIFGLYTIHYLPFISFSLLGLQSNEQYSKKNGIFH
jgi:hypothetical protein